MSGKLAGLLHGWLLASPNPIAEATSGASFAGSEIAALAERAAAALRAGGLEPDEPVHVTIANRPGDIGAMLGVWLAGGVVVPVHQSAAAVTVAALTAATGARFRLDEAELTRTGDAAPPARPELAGAALIIFTSGTTGAPKGVVLGHDALAGKIEALDRLIGVTRNDVVTLPLQLIFIFGVWASLLAIRAGAKLVLVQKFTTPTMARLLAEETTVLGAVPSMIRTLLAGDAGPAPRLRAVLTGGEVLGPSLGERLADAWPDAGVFDLYGLTETGSCDFVLAPAASREGAGSIGVPTEGVDYRLVRDDGREAAAGETGELRIRTPFGMNGYLGAPDLTAQAFADGFFRTGDLARLRADGRVELVGRSKEIISRGGNKISPVEVENMLCAHADVAAALCAGVPDERLGEAIHAVVVLKRGAAASADDLRAWAAQRIERFKIPDVIAFADALPLGATGKASRAAIRAMHGPAS
ncbi:class I adenylate-forming enzyme family protein [Hansschlegelia beijingensis]|uniref:Acyl-CoA synthetase (AMP-forming)/AMP-acid ligase II n=1 Tax=Hansschlegelia beijingensis TaxID=1133344 RepID=A0A7W6GGG0_9HYPH|nr:fatty acid--CoA ligase family protein [Hansschlegelia beijingensis]MBB3974058.1 acyl-CoA synthetase (AMP-forming)/AMP-acid ligase II [Hansschlegelia beijingensis]